MPARRLLPLMLLCAALAAADAPEEGTEVTVKLAAGLPQEDARLGYSRPRELQLEVTVPRFIFEVPEFQDAEPLFFRLSLGETKGVPFYGALDRTKGSARHDLLYLDRDRDLDLTNDGPPVKARIRELFTTEGFLVEFLGITVELPYVIEGKEIAEPYACVLFYVLGPRETRPPALLIERDGWREGTIALEGEEYALALVDDDTDGQFSTGDAWVLRPAVTPKRELLGPDATRSMLFPSWTADQARTIEVKSVDPAGRSATLRVAPAKETEREYFLRVARQRQTEEERELNIDPLRPKADTNDRVDWIVDKDVKWALDIANNVRVQKPVLLEFTARTCPWCARMERYTFRDREVVALSKRFVCARIAFTRNEGDTKKHNVDGTPTYVILALNGAEIARHQGFLRPTDYAAWLKGALR